MDLRSYVADVRRSRMTALPKPQEVAKAYDAPAVESAKALQAAFDYFNEELFRPVFGHALPKVVLNMSRSRSKNAVGTHYSGAWQDESGKVFDEISLTPDGTNRPPAETFSTLCHEMAHLKDRLDGTACKGGYHGRSWTKIMARIGLPERPNVTRGGKLSRLSVSHSIAPDGPFAKVFDAMPEWIKLPFVSTGPHYRLAAQVDPNALQGKRARYECPACASEKGNRAPILRGPSGLAIVCADHNEQYIETGF